MNVSNRTTIILLSIIIVLLAIIIISIGMNLPKVKAKNEKIDKGIADEIDSIVQGNNSINEEVNDTLLNEQQEDNTNQSTTNNVEEENLINEENTRQDYVM